MPAKKVVTVLEAKEDSGRSLLTTAAEGGSVEVFEVALELLGGKVRSKHFFCYRRRN